MSLKIGRWGMRKRELRVAMYSHDTFGLGHLTRTTRIAQGVLRAFPESSVLILSGSPIAHRFTFPSHADYIKLPSVVKAGPNTYSSRELNISQQRIRGMRARLIQDAVDHFSPHVLLVDNVPLGMKSELLPTLRFLRRQRRATQIHLNLRDILDDPAAIRTAWQKSGTRQALDEFFDAVHVFGSAEVFDAITEYELPRAKTDLLGYINPLSVNGETPASLPASRGPVEILVTIGGGGDGHEILNCVATLQRQLGSASPYRFHLVTGPLMVPHARAELSRKVGDLHNVLCHEYLTQLPQWMAYADLVVSMGGYNTLCEVMTRARRSIVIPRHYPRREQEIRASVLAARGVVTAVRSPDLTPTGLDRALRETLERETIQETNRLPDMGGIPRFQKRLGRLLRRVVQPPQRPIAPGNLLLLLLCGLLLSGSAVQAALRPERIALDLSAAYDDNVLNASDAEREAFDTNGPEALFAINRMEDMFVASGAEADWRLGRPWGVKVKGRLSAERIQYLHNPIRSTSSFGMKVQLKLGHGSEVALGARYQPQIYGRHRRDKDALPGAAQFRAEVHRRWDMDLGYEIDVTKHLSIAAEVSGSRKDYNTPFNERDRNRWGLALEAAREFGRSGEWSLTGEYQRASSRNEPDLGKDLSYHEWIVAPAWQLAPPLAFTIGCELTWRTYHSELPEDWNHAGRQDFMGSLEFETRRALSPRIAGFIAYAWRWRSAELDSDVSIDYDEEGTFSESVISAGLRYTWGSR